MNRIKLINRNFEISKHFIRSVLHLMKGFLFSYVVFKLDTCSILFSKSVYNLNVNFDQTT